VTIATAQAAPALTPAVVEAADPRTLVPTLVDLSQADITAMDRSEAEAVVLGCERAIAALRARQSLAMDTLASRVDADLQRRTRERRDDRRHQPGHRPGTALRPKEEMAHPGPDLHGFVASMLAPGLHCSTRTVQRRLEADRRLVRTVESTFQAWWDGDLDRSRADGLAETARSLDASLWARFEALVLETTVDSATGEVSLVSEEVRRMSRSRLARRAARIARHLDPDSHDRATRQARDQRGVVVRPDRHRPGLALWKAHLPSDVSDQVFAAVDGLASRYAMAHPGTGIDAHRADALADLVLGNAEVRTVVELVVPVLPVGAPTAPTRGPLGQLRPMTANVAPAPDAGSGASVDGDGPGGLDGAVSWFIPGVVDDPRHGVLLPHAINALLTRPETVVRLARLDPDGSIVQDPSAYRPSASTRRRVRSRDGICRFPGCTTPARRTDLDHVVEHPHGPTDPGNLICLCRTHHLFKHHSGWNAALAPDGTVSWTAPDGRAWTTQPRPHQIRDELTLLDGIDPETVHHLRRGWCPGLPPGMSLADLIEAEDAQPDDPPETDHTPHAPPDWRDLDQYLPGSESEVPIRESEAESVMERHVEDLLALAA
jgi:hypothetical protein